MKTVFLAALLLLAFGGVFLGWSGSVDDAHITFYAAQVFGERGEILNYNGERVEQSSALLQVLLLGVLHAATGIGVVTLGHLTTLLAALLALPLAYLLAQRLQPGSGSPALLLLATSPFFVYWACGGMESPWLALLLLCLLLLADGYLQRGKPLWWLLPLSLAAQMARPEMPLLLPAFAAALLPLHALLRIAAWRWRSLAALLCLQLLCAAALSAWRWHYFGDVAPQPVSAKVGDAWWANLQHGLQYAGDTVLDLRLALPTLLAIAGTLLVLRQRQPLALLLVVMAWLYAAFVVLSGGDWMAAGRFWVPVLPLLALLASVALHVLFATPQWRYVLLVAVVTGNVLYLWRGTATDFNGVPLWKTTKLDARDRVGEFSFFERHAREHLHDIPTITFVRPLVQQLLATQGPGQPLVVMAGQMGMLPFYLASEYPGRLRFIDRNGITERTLTHCSAAQQLLRTRNGIGTGYEWLLANREALVRQCGFVLPDIVFDIETGWNRKNIAALQQADYVFVYRQRGHIFHETDGDWLPLRRIGAGQFIAVSQSAWERLGRPAAIERVF